MQLLVRIISGFNVGREFDFTGGEKELTIGRAGDADVQLHEDDRSCARGIHARLLLENGLWFIQCEHTNGLTLARDGETILVEQGKRVATGKNARITLGTNGPLIRIGVRSSTREELAPTLRNDEAVPDMPVGELTKDLADAAASVRPGMRRLKRVIAGVAVVAVIGAGAALWRAETVRRRSEQIESAMRAQIESQRNESRAGIQALKGQVADLDERSRNDLIEVLRRAQDSVVMLALAGPNGNVRFIGTGWVVADRKIATNAHVAQVLRDDAGSQGLSPIARHVTADKLHDVAIIKVELHPAFSQWSQILADPTIQVRAGNARADALIHPCDVAVLSTETDCGAPLPIASAQTLAQLKPGDEVGYVGYPSENVYDPRASPPAMLTGRIIRLTDFFYSAAGAEPAPLIHHNLATVGGASGSPILNKSGQVIAINSAASFVGAVATTQQSRVQRVPLGFNYGQTIEFLRECLDGTAEKSAAARNSQWQEKLRAYSTPPQELLAALARADLDGLITSDRAPRDTKLIKLSEQQCKIGTGRDAGAIQRLQLPPGATILVQACADDRSDIDFDIASDAEFNTVLASDTADNAYPRSVFTAPSAGTCWVRFFADRPNLQNPLVFVQVSQLK